MRLKEIKRENSKAVTTFCFYSATLSSYVLRSTSTQPVKVKKLTERETKFSLLISY